ncbi:MAG: anti-sigma factor family protein [Myxococcaceae bacterium]
MSCPSQSELFRLLEGELKERDADRIRSHTQGCASCQARLAEQQTLTSRIGAAFAPSTSDAAVAQVMARLERAAPERAPTPWQWQPWALVAVAAAVAGVIWVSSPRAGGPTLVQAPPVAPSAPVHASPSAHAPPSPAFASRGSQQPLALHQQAGVALYEVADPVKKLSHDSKVSARSSFVAGYTNLGSAGAVFLTLFAVDAKGEVHWLYPGHPTADQDPSSLTLAPARDLALLPEAVTLERPAPGPLRILSIVSRQPLKVSAVESLPPKELNEEALRARWPDASITATRVDITK